MDLPLAIFFGFLFGFVGSMPVAGPIAALVLARAIQGRPRAGLFTAAGAAVAESAYAAFTFWGLATLLGRYPGILPVSRGLAAMALVTLGVLLVRSKLSTSSTKPSGTASIAEGAQPRQGWKGSFFLGFTITALNPTLVATWTAASAALAATGWLTMTPTLALPFALSACAGIVLWFVLLVRLVGRYKDRFRPSTLTRCLQGTGVALLVLGAWFGLGLVMYLVK